MVPMLWPLIGTAKGEFISPTSDHTPITCYITRSIVSTYVRMLLTTVITSANYGYTTIVHSHRDKRETYCLR
jgi:hypothetical protein